MHRMRRESVGPESGPSSRRETTGHQDLPAALQQQPSLAATAIAQQQQQQGVGRATGRRGSAGSDTRFSQQQLHPRQDTQDSGAEFFEAIREEPAPAGGGGDESESMSRMRREAARFEDESLRSRGAC